MTVLTSAEETDARAAWDLADATSNYLTALRFFEGLPSNASPQVRIGAASWLAGTVATLMGRSTISSRREERANDNRGL